MPICPFNANRTDCDTECAMYAHGLEICGFRAMGKMLEEVHDMMVELRENIGQLTQGDQNM